MATPHPHSVDAFDARAARVEVVGRWLSPDPVAGDIFNPQSLNRYAYVLNNPTNLIDPLGLDGQEACYAFSSSYPACVYAGENGWGPFGNCTLDGAPVDCGGIAFFARSEAVVQCPGNVCRSWVSNGQGQIAYAQFHPTLEDPGTWWQIVIPWMFDPALPENVLALYGPDVEGQRVDAARNLVELSGGKLTYEDALAMLDTEKGKLEGGNYNFAMEPAKYWEYSDLCGKSGRCENGLHFRGGFLHVDTFAFRGDVGSGLLHGLVDVLAGNTVFVVIPRH